MQDTIGIDVSKGTLDLHRRADGANVQLGNDTPGFKRLLKWTGPSAAALIVFEATGAYHRSLEKFLNLHRLPYVKVNPKQARRFAQAVGKLAKTDRVTTMRKCWRVWAARLTFRRRNSRTKACMTSRNC